MGTSYFTSKTVLPGTTLIVGMGMENCYLLEGAQGALLIDTLSGIGDLPAYCRELTDLPIAVVNTHGHFDHAGGDFDFGAAYIHPDDVELLYAHATVENRIEYIRMQQGFLPHGRAVSAEDFTPPRPVATYPIYDGDTFDPGGRTLEVIGVPGHTAGTIVLLDRANRALFAGDACNCNTIVCGPAASATVEDYLDGLLHLQAFRPAFDVLYNGHGALPVDASIVEEAIELCREILAGNDDAFPGSFMGFSVFYGKEKLDNPLRRVDGKTANIAYTKDSIHRKSRVRVVRSMPRI